MSYVQDLVKQLHAACEERQVSLNELVFVSRLLAGDPFLPFDTDGEVTTVRLEMTYGPYLALIDEIEHEYQDLRRVLET